MAPRWSFQVEPDVFVELADLEDQYPGQKVTTQPGLALIPGKQYPSDDPEALDQRDWVRFANYVRHLNRNSPDNVSYKVLYLTRHGFGYHNKCHHDVGTEAWNSKWSFMNGTEDGTVTWFDAHLTDVGIQQAHDLNAFWSKLIDQEGAPLPQTLYTSPLARCLQTTKLVFSPIMQAHGRPFCPIVKEKLRERMTQHTCDYRRPAAWIRDNWPEYAIEDGFDEEDQFGKDGKVETDEQHTLRKQSALEDIFDTDRGEFLALMVHSYAIRAIQDACRARMVKTREGTSLALLVRGEKRILDNNDEDDEGADLTTFTGQRTSLAV